MLTEHNIPKFTPDYFDDSVTAVKRGGKCYTPQEEILATVQAMKDTIDRVMKMENKINVTMNDFISHISKDNVLFKDLVRNTYTTFSQEVKNEVNSFESDIDNAISLFTQTIQADYAGLNDECKALIVENEKKYNSDVEKLTALFESFKEALTSTVENNNTTHEQALEDFQTKLTTELNTFIADVNAKHTRFTESMTETWETFKTTWESIITNRLDGQDAKINDNELYMKTNLTATITALIGDMKDNGELEAIINGEVFNGLEEKIESAKREYALADSEANIEIAVTDCLANNKIFYVPKGVTLTIDETLDLTGFDVDIQGILRITHSGIGVIAGGVSSSPNKRSIEIYRIEHVNYADGDISVRLVGMSNGNVHIYNAPYVQLYADGDTDYGFIAYSNFCIGKCNVLEIIDNPESVNYGWINENTFYNCRVLEELRIVGNKYEHNENIFYKPCVENAKVYFNGVRSNKMYDARTEGNNFALTFDEKSYNNTVITAFEHRNPTLVNVVAYTDNGTNNLFITSTYNNLKSALIYAMDADIFNNNIYKVAQKEYFSVADDKIFCSEPWKNFLSDEIIPVNNIHALACRCSTGSLRIYATGLDENKEPILSNCLNYPASTFDTATGEYSIAVDGWGATITKLTNDVKYIKLSIVSGSTQTPIDHFALVAWYHPENFHNAMRLSERFKTAIPTL